MSWPQWPQQMSMQPPSIVTHPPQQAFTAPQYTSVTSEQLAIQQNWQQWQTYHQQYAQWHAQYGEQYQREMQAKLGTAPPPLPLVPNVPPYTAPVPQTNVPPPSNVLPIAGIPPTNVPPPVMSNIPSAYTVPPPPPPRTNVDPMMNNIYQNTSRPPPPPPPAEPNKGSGSSKNQSAVYGPMNYDDILSNRNDRNSEIREQSNKDSQEHWGNKSQTKEEERVGSKVMGRNKASKSQSQNAYKKESKKIQDQKFPEERFFDEQFKKWEEDFEKWKRQNSNHPDKKSYREYEQKFEDCRRRLLERREQMRRRRLTNTAVCDNDNNFLNVIEDANSKNNQDSDFSKQMHKDHTEDKEAVMFINESKENENASTENKGHSDIFQTTKTEGIPGLDLVSNDNVSIEKIDVEKNDKIVEIIDLESTGSNSVKNTEEKFEKEKQLEKNIPSLFSQKIDPPFSPPVIRSEYNSKTGSENEDSISRDSHFSENRNKMPSDQPEMCLQSNNNNTPSLINTENSNIPSVESQNTNVAALAELAKVLSNPSILSILSQALSGVTSSGQVEALQAILASQTQLQPQMQMDTQAQNNSSSNTAEPGSYISPWKAGQEPFRNTNQFSEILPTNNFQTNCNTPDRWQSNQLNENMNTNTNMNISANPIWSNNSIYDNVSSTPKIWQSGCNTNNNNNNSSFGNRSNFISGNLSGSRRSNERDEPDMSMRSMDRISFDGSCDDRSRSLDRDIRNKSNPFRNDVDDRKRSNAFGNEDGPKNSIPRLEDIRFDFNMDMFGNLDSDQRNQSRSSNLFRSNEQQNIFDFNQPIITETNTPQQDSNEFFRPAQIIDYANQPVKPLEDINIKSILFPQKVVDYGHTSTNPISNNDSEFFPRKTIDYGHSNTNLPKNNNDNNRNNFHGGQSGGNGRQGGINNARRSRRRNKNRNSRFSNNFDNNTSFRSQSNSSVSNDGQSLNRTAFEKNSPGALKQDKDIDNDMRTNKPSKETLDQISDDDRELDDCLKPVCIDKNQHEHQNKTDTSIFPNYGSTFFLNEAMYFDRREIDNSQQIYFDKEKGNDCVLSIDEIILKPGRNVRPKKLVIILRGLPGSGKTYIAKLIKKMEVELGGSTPRLLSIDDYFMSEVEKEEKCPKTGKKILNKDMVYDYEEQMENTYMQCLIKSYKKTITDGLFDFIIVDCINNTLTTLKEFYEFAKISHFTPYIIDISCDLDTCLYQNVHKRSAEDIKKIMCSWEQTPNSYTKLDVTSLLQSAAITEVEMDDVSDMNNELEENETETEEQECIPEQFSFLKSKWDVDTFDEKLARLDGINKPLQKSATLEDYLQMDEWELPLSSSNSKKRVRWADIEEKRAQEKMRAIGFVVGQTDWNRMLDPTKGSSALTKTKFIEKVNKN